MRPRTKSATLWGLVGAFAFLAAHQGYLLLGGAFTSVGIVAAVTLVVFLVTALCAYRWEVRLLQYGR